LAVNVSKEKGTRKSNVGQSCLLPELGLKDDAHGGKWHRQVSLLAIESIAKMTHLGLKVGPGDFAENITTQDLNLIELPVGTRFTIGQSALLEVTQIGKVCHTRCAIYYQAGDCVMPKEGIFAKVITGGEIKVGDEIHVLGGNSDHQR
jgi:MOSC domain-containing protein YiiM